MAYKEKNNPKPEFPGALIFRKMRCGEITTVEITK